MKKSYEKAEVAKVKLAAEEALLTACKTGVPGSEAPECVRDGVVVILNLGS